MKIEIQFRGVMASEALREHVSRRVAFQLDHLSDHVASVTLRLEDINGPKGGVDMRCTVLVRGTWQSPVMVCELSDSPYVAVDLALERVARAVGRDLGRQRSSRRQAGEWRSAS